VEESSGGPFTRSIIARVGNRSSSAPTTGKENLR
jgi:hypothetical protein